MKNRLGSGPRGARPYGLNLNTRRHIWKRFGCLTGRDLAAGASRRFTVVLSLLLSRSHMTDEGRRPQPG